MVNQITNHLAVSDAAGVRNLPDTHEYDLVVTMGYFDKLGYTRPDASDTEDTYVVSDGEHDYETFAQAADLVREGMREGQNVLVHCQAGCSRSPAVCIAALAAEFGDTYDEARREVTQARPQTNVTEPLEASARRYIDENSH